MADEPNRQQAVPEPSTEAASPILDAEILYEGPVPPTARHPFRFGLKALLALMAVCSGQFAVMFYVGILAGLLWTALICAGLLALLLVCSLVVPRKARVVWIGRLDQLAIQLAIAVVLLLAGAAFAGGGMALYYQVQSFRLARNIQSHLGFTASIETVLTTKDDLLATTREALVVRNITTDGAFHQAGFQKNDVILTDLTPREYYQMLDENRGSTITVDVASGAVGSVLTPVEDCPQRTLTLAIPP